MKSNVVNKLKKAATNKRDRFLLLNQIGLYRMYRDEVFLKKCYRNLMGRELNLSNPCSFNEKLNWLKIYNRTDEQTIMVDKYLVKKYIAEKIGEKYVIPLIGVWDHFDDIDFQALPDSFVLKCTHDSGGLVVCKEKKDLDLKSIKKKINKSMKKNYYWFWREWPYKNVKPKIIAEEYMKDRDYDVLNVYKIFNFNNGPRIIQVIQGDKTQDESIDYFDENWNKLDLRQNYKNSDIPLEKPETFVEMLELAKQLSEGFPFLRTDFFEINGRVYFSEFTFFSDAGLTEFHPETWDTILGERIKLPYIEGL